jgi:putative membrane protein
MRNDVKNDLILMFKGFIIGSSMSVPGISGGTMAILLGIYDKLISSISNYFKDIKGNTLYLSKALLGSLIGIGSLAFVIQWLLNNYPMYISFFFLGAVIGGVPALIKKTQEKTMKISSLMYILIGLMIVISISFIPTGNFSIVSGFRVCALSDGIDYRNHHRTCTDIAGNQHIAYAVGHGYV